MTTTKTLNIRNLVLIAMMAAIAMVLMLFEVPLPMIAPSFYEIDLSELPVLIGTFAMGPVAGVLIELVKILLKLLIKGTSTAYVGDLANFLVGCSFLLPAGIIDHMKKTKKSAIIGMIAGTVTMAVAGCFLNAFLLLPFYANSFFASAGGMDAILAAGAAVHPAIGSVAGFVILCVAPFNLIKGVIISVLTMLLYKRVSVVIHGVQNH